MATGTLVTGLFNRAADAERALTALLAAGFTKADVSAVAADGTKMADFGIEKHSRVGAGAAIGGGFGGALGALLAGFTAVGALVTGGVGLIVAGPIVAALAGAGAGAAAGGVVGGLIGLGVPEHEVKFYAESFEKGSVLLGVRTGAPASVEQAREIFKQHGAAKITSQSVELAGSTAKTSASGVQLQAADDWARSSPLRKLFVDQLRDIYYAEHQLVDGLDKLESHASKPELASAFREHGAQTRQHIQRLDNIFELIGVKPEQKKCAAINGILSEAKELMGLDETFPLRDAALICAAQKAEHYEIGTYGCLRTYAQTLGLSEPARILGQTLAEEWDADQRLTDLAESGINRQATAVAAGA